MDERLKHIADVYEQTYVYMFGDGGKMQGTLPDDQAKTSVVATIIIQFEKQGGFRTDNPTQSNNPKNDGEKCPKCGGPVKKGVNKLGKPYTSCSVCRLWINDFGKTTPMVN